MWHHVAPQLSEHFRLLTFDNRGIGRSSKVPGPHLMSTMASDAAAVLEAAGLKSANVMGISMGGYIAQEFALQYPDRLNSLILGCTSCGGENAVLAAPEVLEVLRARATMRPEEGIRALVPYIYGPKTHSERIESDLEIRMRTYPSEDTYTAQLDGIAVWSSYSRLGQIRAKTLVIHGDHDGLVPQPNGRLLAERIPSATFVGFEESSHIFFTDQPEKTVKTVQNFLI